MLNEVTVEKDFFAIRSDNAFSILAYKDGIMMAGNCRCRRPCSCC